MMRRLKSEDLSPESLEIFGGFIDSRIQDRVVLYHVL